MAGNTDANVHCGKQPDTTVADLAALRRKWAWMYQIAQVRDWLMAWRHTGKGRMIIVRDVAGLAAAIEADAAIPAPRIAHDLNPVC